jgi:hypothetical protein
MSSSELIGQHDKDKLPLIDDKGIVFCAFSLENKMPPCPFDHRGPKVEVIIGGVITQVHTCCDSRMHTDSFKPIK